MPTTLHLTSLGSSFAAGPCIPPIENASAGRSSRNYAHLLAARLDANLTDLTVSGATLLNLLSEPQTIGSTTFPPQIEGIPSDTDLVTVTCGGNDLNYIGGLCEAARRSYFGGRVDTRNIPAISFGELKQRLLTLLDAIHARAPKARILLVQYLPLIGPCTRPLYDIPLSVSSLQHFSAIADGLAEVYVQVAAERAEWTEVVRVAEQAKGHALGSEEAWVRGFEEGGCSFHPTGQGHKGVAGILAKVVLGRAWREGGWREGGGFETGC